jgi:tRNA A37 methylthiotransferase MiaB
MCAGKAVRCRWSASLAEVRTLVDAGYREVVISGINLGRWGRDLEVVALVSR